MLAKKSCPKCENKNIAHILYGMPNSNVMRKVLKGQVVLGGCIIAIDSPQYHCNDCEYRWSDDIVIETIEEH